MAVTTSLSRADSGVVTTVKKSVSKPQSHSQCEEPEQPMIHPLVRDVKMQVDEYILQSWDFQDDDVSRRDFESENISSVASYYFPSALDERIFLVSRLLSVLFLITESLVQFDLDDGEEYIEALEAAVKGHWQPDESIPAVWMLCGIFDEIRAQDYMLADDIIETAFSHLRYVTHAFVRRPDRSKLTRDRGGLVRRGRSTQRRGTGSSASSFRVGASLLSSLEPLAMGTSGDCMY